ncbi:MAG: hypothetical protein BRD29_03445 [Bacteroidetes bacterium QH_2_67_10]|nr:MAG: hypothetical protein BRD29_03445 [Bacteroidetes bacterium QH_2_67_10]
MRSRGFCASLAESQAASSKPEQSRAKKAKGVEEAFMVGGLVCEWSVHRWCVSQQAYWPPQPLSLAAALLCGAGASAEGPVSPSSQLLMKSAVRTKREATPRADRET